MSLKARRMRLPMAHPNPADRSPQTRVSKKSGQVVCILEADGARIEREYRS
jgi:hypothetical protein